MRKDYLKEKTNEISDLLHELHQIAFNENEKDFVFQRLVTTLCDAESALWYYIREIYNK